MNTFEEVDVQIRFFLISALAGDERSASHPGRHTPGERALDRKPGGPQSPSGRHGEVEILGFAETRALL
jgi:hypothetical protein